MIRIPAPYLRGLAVLTIGTSFVLGYAALAATDASASRPAAPTQVAIVFSPAGAAGRQQAQSMALAENCYLEVQEDLTPQGKTVSRIVHECD